MEPKQSGPEVELDPAGSGPEVAGYDTEHYDILVKGSHCGSVLVSKQAMEDTGAGAVLTAMNRLSSQTMAIARCSRAAKCRRR